MICVLALTLASLTDARTCAPAEFARDLGAMSRVLPEAPCSLKDRRQPLEVILIGENHHSLVAQEIRATGVRRANRGEIAFLTETTNDGALLPKEVPARSTLVGLESAAGLSVLIAYSIRGPTQDYDVLRAISILKTYVPRLPLLKDAVTAATADPSDEMNRRVRAALDGAGDRLGREARDVVNRITTEALRLASTKYAAQLDGSAWPDVPYQPDQPDYETLHTRLMSLRDRDFTRTAAHEICGLARQFPRVFMNVGDAHAPEMRRALEATFGSGIKVRYFDPFAGDESREALRLLKE